MRPTWPRLGRLLGLEDFADLIICVYAFDKDSEGFDKGFLGSQALSLVMCISTFLSIWVTRPHRLPSRHVRIGGMFWGYVSGYVSGVCLAAMFEGIQLYHKPLSLSHFSLKVLNVLSRYQNPQPLQVFSVAYGNCAGQA